MASHSCDQADKNDPEVRKAFQRCMMRNALLHRAGQELDPLHVYRFQALDLPLNVNPPPLPPAVPEILRNPDHADRIPVLEGPLVFVRQEHHCVVLDSADLLLRPEDEIRRAAAQYLKRGASSHEPWLTPSTVEVLESRLRDSGSEDIARWRAAGIELVPLVREDLFAHLAALRQSHAARYEEGLQAHLAKVMRPRFRTLVNLRPPVWSPTEQRDEIKAWIGEFAGLPTVDAALTEYINRCGYIPLCAEFGAAEVARRWIEQHPDSKVTWDDIWSWAESVDTQLAKYHAVTVAMHIPSTRPAGSMEQFWREVLDILEVSGPDEATPTSTNVWPLYCQLAAHFALHIESLHPGQDGERVACYAWWLADKVGRILGKSDELAKRALDKIVRREAASSFSRWAIARSPVVPSAFRYVTVYMNSVWGMSLVVQLSRTIPSLPLDEVPADLRDKIRDVLAGYLLTSPSANQVENREPVFAFQEDLAITDLCSAGGLLAAEEREVLAEVMPLRQQIATAAGLQSRLERLRELPAYEQRLTVLFLREAVSSTYKFDDAIVGWLTQTDQVVDDLRCVQESVLEVMLEALAEFQQHLRAEWVSRLPHVLACAIERSDSAERVRLLHVHAMFMSINGGIASPIQRIASSKRRSDLLTPLAVWRENIVEVARRSEPWVVARVRAISAAISRIIGPRNRNISASGPGPTVEP